MDPEIISEIEPEPEIEEEAKSNSTVVEDDPKIDFQSREKLEEEAERFKDERKYVTYNYYITKNDNSQNKREIREINSGGNVSINDGNNKFGGSNINQHLLSVALSVLSGCRKDIFFEESKVFRNLIVQESGRAESLVNQDFSELENSNWLTEEDTFLKKLNAVEENADDNDESGPCSVKILKFSDSEYQNRVLLKFWKGNHSFHDTFLKWIVSLGRHKNFNVRIKASETIGKIIYAENTSFSVIKEKVLLPWATSGERYIKRLLCWALSFPIGQDSSDSGIENQILGLLNHWITQRGNVSLRQTAALTYASEIGLQFPERVIKSFNTVTLRGDWILFFPIAETISDLFEAGEVNDELYGIILQTLSEWSSPGENKHSMRFQISQFILWLIMLQRVSENKKFNTLLWLIKKDKDRYGVLLSNIFRQSLFSQRPYLDLIFEEMREWTAVCLKDAKYYRAIGFLFVSIIRQGKSNEVIRLLGFLKHWRDVYKIEGAKKILIDIEQYLNMEQKQYVRNI